MQKQEKAAQSDLVCWSGERESNPPPSFLATLGGWCPADRPSPHGMSRYYPGNMALSSGVPGGTRTRRGSEEGTRWDVGTGKCALCSRQLRRLLRYPITLRTLVTLSNGTPGRTRTCSGSPRRIRSPGPYPIRLRAHSHNTLASLAVKNQFKLLNKLNSQKTHSHFAC